MASVKRTVRQSQEMAACIKAISEELPALKESEIVPYCYHLMAQDFLNGTIDASIWPKMLKQNFEDKQVAYSETRGITVELEDFNVVVTGKKDGKNDGDNTWAYMAQPGVARAPLALVTKLVLYYVRLKLVGEKEAEAKPKVQATNVDCLEIMEKAVATTIELLREGNFKKIFRYIGEGE